MLLLLLCKTCNIAAALLSNWEETRGDAGLDSQLKYEGSLISPQMGVLASNHNSGSAQKLPFILPAFLLSTCPSCWRQGNLRMVQVCFLCGLMLGELWSRRQQRCCTLTPQAICDRGLGAALGRALLFLGLL